MQTAYNPLDVYDPTDETERAMLIDELETYPDDYNWEELADYGIEKAWVQAAWKGNAELAAEEVETPRWTAKEFMYTSR